MTTKEFKELTPREQYNAVSSLTVTALRKLARDYIPDSEQKGRAELVKEMRSFLRADLKINPEDILNDALRLKQMMDDYATQIRSEGGNAARALSWSQKQRDIISHIKSSL